MGSMSFTATRNLGADLTIPLTIPFTVSGTAVFGPDYSCTGADTFSVSSGQLTIPIGSSSATIVVTATPTTVAGLSKSITLTPVAVENKWAIITSSLPWTGTILNLNPASPSLSIINNGTINYSITSDVSSTNPIIINFLRRVTNGSNPAVITSGTVTLPAGATIVNLARVDLSGTSTETVVLQAGSQLSYILSTSTTATINAVTVGVALPTISISLNASAGWVITRTGSTVNSLTVNYSRNVTPISGIQTVNTGVVVIIAGATSINVPITTSSLDRTETLALIAEATYLLGTPTSVSIILTPSITSPSISVSSLVNNTGWTISASPTVSTDTVVNIRQVVTVGFNLPTTTNSTVTILANTSGINVLATTATTARTEALTILTGTGYTIGTPTATLTYTGVLPKATVAVSNDGTGFSINLDLPQLNATTVNLNRTYTHAGIQDLSTAIAVVIPAGSTTVYQSINPVNTDGTTGSVSLAIAAGSSYNTNISGSNLGILATVPLPNSQLPIVTVSAFTDNSGWKFTLSSVQTTNRTVNYTLLVTPTSGSPTVTYGSMTINAGALTANVLVSNSTGSRVEALTLALGNSYLPTAPNYVLQTVSIAIGSITPPTSAPDTSALHLLFAQNLLDSSTTPKTITPNGVTISTTQTKYPAGSGNGSAYFDGTKAIGFPRDGVDGVNILNFANWTLECWVYPTVLALNSNVIFSTYNNPGGAQGSTFILFADAFSNGLANGFTFTPVLNVWQHYAVTYDQPSNTFKGYYNGNLIGTTSSLGFVAGSTTNYIGGSPGDNNIGNRFFNGYIDDFIITPSTKYTANFSPIISSLVAASAPTPTILPYRSSLILNCKFDGANGSTAFVDDYGATIARAGAGNTAISTAQAKFGTGSLYVDGTPLVISDSVGKDKYNFPVEYTVQMWVYVSANTVFDTAGEYLFTRADNVNGGFEYGFSLTSNSLGMYYGIRGSSQRYYTATIPTLNVGWNHIAFTRDVTTVMRFFANGVLGTGTSSTPTDGTALGNPGNQNRVYIGGFFPPYGLAQGLYIDSLEVDNVCLYNAAFTPPTVPTLTPVAPAGTTDPLFSSVVLLMPMTTASGITDVKGKVAINQGATQSTAILDPFGQNAGVVSFPGGGARISVAQSNDFAFTDGAFAIDGWFYPTAIPSGIAWGVMDTRTQADLSNWVISGNSTGRIGFTDFSYNTFPFNEFSSSPLILNQWNYFCTSRTADATDNHKTWLNGSLIGTATTRNNAINAAGNLLIGDIIDTSPDYSGSFTGYMSNIRITRAYRDGSIVPTAPAPAPVSTTLTGVPSAYSTSLWVAGSSATANTSNQITQIVNSNSNAVTKAVTAPANLSTSLIKLFDPTVNANVLAQNTTNNGYLIVDSKASPIQWLAMVLINDLPNDNTVGQCIFGSSNSYPWHPAAGTLMYSNVGGAEAQNGAQVYINGSSMGIGGTAVIKPPTWTIQYWDMANNTTAAFDYIGGRDRDDQYSISYWQGKFAEIIVGTALLPVADRNKIEGYLAWKYQLNANLPAGHPYKNSAP